MRHSCVKIARPCLHEAPERRQVPEIIALVTIPLSTAAALWTIRAVLNTAIVLTTLCWLPFALMTAVFLFGLIGLAYSIYPFVVIDQLTIWQAASSPEALKVILIGVCIAVPAIAGYTIYSYWVFRGKTGELKYA